MAMAAPAAKAAASKAGSKAGTSAASKAKNVTPKKTTTAKKSTASVAPRASTILTKQAVTNIGVQGHQARANISAETHERKQQSRVNATRQISLDRQAIRQQAEAEQYRLDTGRKRKSKVIGTATGLAKQPFEKHPTYSVGPNPIMLIVFTMAGVILVYAMITSPAPTSRFFSSMLGWVKLFYTTEPIFSVKKVVDDRYPTYSSPNKETT